MKGHIYIYTYALIFLHVFSIFMSGAIFIILLLYQLLLQNNYYDVFQAIHEKEIVNIQRRCEFIL